MENTQRLWHDDVREPPEPDWVWCRTNDEAETCLLENVIRECSLDHDLGANPADGPGAQGTSPNGNGLDLVRWMIYNDLVPERVVIHSHNPPGADAMAKELRGAGHNPITQPFSNG